MSKPIVVIGSSNTDMVVRTPYFPKGGETVLGNDFLMNTGGKGANQAVAASRLGEEVCFICRVGEDLFGRNMWNVLGKENINTTYMIFDNESPSGTALITVNASGENTIVVASGANYKLLPDDITAASGIIKASGCVLIQLEIPIDTVLHAARLAKMSKVPVILNPAPACVLPDELYHMINIITPNETEASILSGIHVTDLNSAKKAALAIHSKGVPVVIITLGAEGALLYQSNSFIHVLTPQIVEVVDTTAAGDVFNGALASALNKGTDLKTAVEFACRASSISVTRAGAQSSAPYSKELEMSH